MPLHAGVIVPVIDEVIERLLTLMVTVLEVTGFPVTQVKSEVSTQVIASLFAGVYE
jgi:hypothetical protein